MHHWNGKVPLLGIVSFAVLLAAPCALYAQASPNAEVEAKVRAAFADAPEMIEIAKCESGYRQFGPDGSALRGGAMQGYIGIFQIGERLHAQNALAKGMDIFTIDGNIAYARVLYAASGTNPWWDCLKPATATIAVTTPVTGEVALGAITSNLRFGMLDPQVMILQRTLNKIGFAVAAEGPGSAGNETTRFGALTREAVRRFQCAKQIACDGDESSTGYGRVGPRTRAILRQMIQLP